ncbi:hypothetical protein GCM10012290_15070 [Halolactibacillus alkaliphilus]|uniref:Aldose 1-epimerase n=1 Tax=Halolactibacillus alkaliphilus TaxID=442899 RepID=A0A511X1C6_9BACI|nr:aldose epimerase [Halolactibacillus alkaliphilus]GEN56753.1 hypothetical protein HAL01_12170 [Halolactibacillus alkaliphilus]GGN70833.1 hypothetical protein GCM10012290_15070 [Halolactibacillus alkaliphilus]SFO79868.1 Galactose mutarotase [Halolactibacillus alkaliphilus]
MYTIERFEKEMFMMYQLKHPTGNSWITVCPERGGIITSYGTNNEERLYLNEATLFDRKKNVRGGIPVLFPISGQLHNGRYEWEGKVYDMPNHGLARIHPWEVLETHSDEDHAFISIMFRSSLSTKGIYPFDFKVIFTYTLREDQLLIHQTYENLSDQPMPIYPGLHPYFKSDKKVIGLDIETKTYFDYNDEQEKQFTGQIDLTHLKEAVRLENTHTKVKATVDDQSINMTMDEEFHYTVLWTEKDQGFVCVEPWTRDNGELNRQEQLIEVAPHDVFETWVNFQVL